MSVAHIIRGVCIAFPYVCDVININKSGGAGGHPVLNLVHPFPIALFVFVRSLQRHFIFYTSVFAPKIAPGSGDPVAEAR